MKSFSRVVFGKSFPETLRVWWSLKLPHKKLPYLPSLFKSYLAWKLLRHKGFGIANNLWLCLLETILGGVNLVGLSLYLLTYRNNEYFLRLNTSLVIQKYRYVRTCNYFNFSLTGFHFKNYKDNWNQTIFKMYLPTGYLFLKLKRFM